MRIFSFSPFGYEGSLVSVEVDLRRGIPAVDIVGLADGAVKESRERMRSAIRNCGFEFPPERVLISLSPADLKKEGAGFDLPVALAVLEAKKRIDVSGNSEEGLEKCFSEKSILVMGELELNGKVRPVRGIHAAASTAMASGIDMCIVPKENFDEAMEVPGLKVFGASTLEEAFSALDRTEEFLSRKERNYQSEEDLPQGSECVDGVWFGPVESSYEFGEIHGQEKLVRALQIAAAGGHNVLAFGPPGCGKTLSMQRYPALLPLLSLSDAQPVTRIYSIAGLLKPNNPIIRTAPFRQPHQTASIEGICGGGPHCTPGEISLAHNGVLFLDEAAEFRGSVLQMLRVPLETRAITLCRAGRSTTFPANFQLLMATNPCPCGNYGSSEKICLCSSRSVDLYWKKFSGPLLDRIDLRVHAENSGRDLDSSETKGMTTRELRIGIAKAVKTQMLRQGKKNALLSSTEIERFCVMDEEAASYLIRQSEKNGFSPRAADCCRKTARTICDMNGKETIGLEEIREAVDYRKVEGGVNV